MLLQLELWQVAHCLQLVHDGSYASRWWVSRGRRNPGPLCFAVCVFAACVTCVQDSLSVARLLLTHSLKRLHGSSLAATSEPVDYIQHNAPNSTPTQAKLVMLSAGGMPPKLLTLPPPPTTAAAASSWPCCCHAPAATAAAAGHLGNTLLYRLMHTASLCRKVRQS